MFAGCLPLLFQLPFFSVMYRLFTGHFVGGAANTLLTHSLLAAPLGSHWLAGAGPLSAQGAVFAGLFVLLAVVGVLAVRVARRATPPGSRKQDPQRQDRQRQRPPHRPAARPA